MESSTDYVASRWPRRSHDSGVVLRSSRWHYANDALQAGGRFAVTVDGRLKRNSKNAGNRRDVTPTSTKAARRRRRRETTRSWEIRTKRNSHSLSPCPPDPSRPLPTTGSRISSVNHLERMGKSDGRLGWSARA